MDNQLTLEQFKAKKKALEISIRVQLENFEELTGVEVTEVITHAIVSQRSGQRIRKRIELGIQID